MGQVCPKKSNRTSMFLREATEQVCSEERKEKLMEAKDVVTIVVAVALAAVIGFLMIKMMQNFMAADGIFEGFIKSIFTTIYEKALGMMN